MIRKGINPYEQASFGLRNRLGRVVWGVIYHGFFKWTPRAAHPLRALVLKLFGAKLGRHCHVYPNAKIWAPWNLEMADHACLADNVTCYSMALIRIGQKAVVSQGAHLCAGTHDYEDPNFQLYALPITVGANAWVCTEAFVGPGVEIGAGCVIGARAVVTKSMPEWTVCAGNPCIPIKRREIRRDEERSKHGVSDEFER